MPRSVNKAIIVGNLTRDPEMRYTPQGHAVTSFGVATNRDWVTEGEKKEQVEFHNVVAWNKLAEICSQLLSKGRKVYIEGRLQTRNWEDQNGTKQYRTEIVANEMVALDPRPVSNRGSSSEGNPGDTSGVGESAQSPKDPPAAKAEESVSPDEIPF